MNHFLAKTMKVNDIFICFTNKDHTNILHVPNTIVSCLPLCFCSHLLHLTLFYFKIQQAVLSWHFKHTAIVVKYLPNVSSPLHLSVTSGTAHTLFSMFPDIYHWVINLCPQVLSIFLPLPPVSLYLITSSISSIYFSLPKIWRTYYSVSLCSEGTSLFSHPFLPPALFHSKLTKISHWVHSTKLLFCFFFFFWDICVQVFNFLLSVG